MASVRFRILSLIFLCFLPAFLILALILLNGRSFFGLFGIAEYDGDLMSILVSIPIVLAFPLVWQRLVLKIPCPPLSQAFLHPRNATRSWEMKVMIALYLVTALLMYSNYQCSLPSLVSLGLTFASLYAFIVIYEVMLHMAKDERVWHPFRQNQNQ